MVLIFLPDGTNICGLESRQFEGIRLALGVENCKTVFLEMHFLLTWTDTFAVECGV